MEDTAKPPRRKRGRPANISRDGIIEAALAIGFHGISMHAIARRLGVAVSALYRHVESKDELLLLCTDIVSQKIIPQETDSWQDHLRVLARSYRKVTLSMPGSVEFVREVGLTTPAACAVVDWSLGVLSRSGFPGNLAYMTCIGMISHATDMALHEEQDRRNAGLRGGAEAEEVLRERSQTYPNIGWALSGNFTLDREEYFELGLRVYIDGIEAALREQPVFSVDTSFGRPRYGRKRGA
jgi:AcrR family transcriptional regulator